LPEHLALMSTLVDVAFMHHCCINDIQQDAHEHLD
jgi:hypothetical protein